MAISSIGSWLPTIDEFSAHWVQVNDFLVGGGGSQLELTNGYKQSNLDSDRTALAAAISAVQPADNARQIAAADRDNKRATIRPRMLQFGPSVRGLLPGSTYIRGIPRTPPPGASPGKWRDAMDDFSSLWASINANTPAYPGFTPPLLLAGGYAVAAFNSEAAALSTAFTTVGNADQAANLVRAQRDAEFAPIYDNLRIYRQVIQGQFAEGDPLLTSLPRLTPLPGSTPAAVNLSGSWNPSSVMANLVFSESTAPDFSHYQIRYHPGPRYKAAEEQVVDDVPAGTLNFETNFGLVASGSVAWFKVYVVTTTLNEKGSNAVKIVRP